MSRRVQAKHARLESPYGVQYDVLEMIWFSTMRYQIIFLKCTP